MIGTVLGIIILLVLGLFSITTFILANELDKYIDYPMDEDKNE